MNVVGSRESVCSNKSTKSLNKRGYFARCFVPCLCWQNCELNSHGPGHGNNRHLTSSVHLCLVHDSRVKKLVRLCHQLRPLPTPDSLRDAFDQPGRCKEQVS